MSNQSMKTSGEIQMNTSSMNVTEFKTTGADIGRIDNVGGLYVNTTIRTPLELFKASAAVTAGASWVLGMILFASRSLEYIKTFF